MRTRSEWFLGARGGSLELSSDTIRPPTSTSLHAGQGIIGTYNILYDNDNFNNLLNNYNNNNRISSNIDSNNHHNHSLSSYNLNSNSNNARQSNLSIIIFTVLDFLF